MSKLSVLLYICHIIDEIMIEVLNKSVLKGHVEFLDIFYVQLEASIDNEGLWSWALHHAVHIEDLVKWLESVWDLLLKLK